MTADYLHAVRQILDHLEHDQADNIERAATIVADAMHQRGTINCAEIGHGVEGDFINRAGGLLSVRKFDFRSQVENPVAACRRGEHDHADRDLEQVRFAVGQSNLRAADVMFVSSVSGRNRRPIELALACREIGVHTIGFTSLSYTREVASLHPSGKRLAEAVELVIDIGVPYGDAMVEIDGYENKVVPLSGLSQLVGGWLIFGNAMAKMAATGKPASYQISHNRDGGPAFNEQAQARYHELGF